MSKPIYTTQHRISVGLLVRAILRREYDGFHLLWSDDPKRIDHVIRSIRTYETVAVKFDDEFMDKLTSEDVSIALTDKLEPIVHGWVKQLNGDVHQECGILRLEDFV